MNIHSTRTVNVPRKRQTNPGELYTSVAWIRCQQPGTRKHLNRKRKQRPGPGKRNSFPNWGYGENMVMPLQGVLRRHMHKERRVQTLKLPLVKTMIIKMGGGNHLRRTVVTMVKALRRKAVKTTKLNISW
jgi:hypothetical protein